MMVDDNGEQVAAPVTPEYSMRLAIQDDMRIIGTRVIAYAGTAEGQVVRFEFCLQDGCRTMSPSPSSPRSPSQPPPSSTAPSTCSSTSELLRESPSPSPPSASSQEGLASKSARLGGASARISLFGTFVMAC